VIEPVATKLILKHISDFENHHCQMAIRSIMNRSVWLSRRSAFKTVIKLLGINHNIQPLV